MKRIFAMAAVLFVGAAVNAGPVEDGKAAFTSSQCATCHSLTSKKEASQAGPALYGVTKRAGRSKDWMVKWMSDPEAMLKTDTLAKQLLKESNNVPMPAMLKTMNGGKMDVVATKANAIYEFLKDNDSKPDAAAAAGGAKKKKD